MSYDLLFGARDMGPRLDTEQVRAWFAGRGYTMDHPSQACWLTEDGDMLWDFNLVDGADASAAPELDRPLLIEGSAGSASETNFFAFIKEARALCERFDLVVCDPQGETLDFHTPEQYFVVPAGG